MLTFRSPNLIVHFQKCTIKVGNRNVSIITGLLDSALPKPNVKRPTAESSMRLIQGCLHINVLNVF